MLWLLPLARTIAQSSPQAYELPGSRAGSLEELPGSLPLCSVVAPFFWGNPAAFSPQEVSGRGVCHIKINGVWTKSDGLTAASSQKAPLSSFKSPRKGIWWEDTHFLSCIFSKVLYPDQNLGSTGDVGWGRSVSKTSDPKPARAGGTHTCSNRHNCFCQWFHICLSLPQQNIFIATVSGHMSVLSDFCIHQGSGSPNLMCPRLIHTC